VGKNTVPQPKGASDSEKGVPAGEDTEGTGEKEVFLSILGKEKKKLKLRRKGFPTAEKKLTEADVRRARKKKDKRAKKALYRAGRGIQSGFGERGGLLRT